MRGYLPVTPNELEEFSTRGLYFFQSAYVLTSSFQRNNIGEDHEELEFQLSYVAALESRRLNQSEAGFVLAVDLEESQLGAEHEEKIEILSDLRWGQVDSVLVAESEEEELSWFASQEVEVHLPIWLKMVARNGAA